MNIKLELLESQTLSLTPVLVSAPSSLWHFDGDYIFADPLPAGKNYVMCHRAVLDYTLTFQGMNDAQWHADFRLRGFSYDKWFSRYGGDGLYGDHVVTGRHSFVSAPYQLVKPVVDVSQISLSEPFYRSLVSNCTLDVVLNCSLKIYKTSTKMPFCYSNFFVDL